MWKPLALLGYLLTLAGCGDPAPAPTPEPPAAPATQPHAATLRGRVAFTGPAPVMATLDNHLCHHQNPKPIRDESVIVNPNGTLRNVVVYLRDTRGGPAHLTPVVDQVDCRYAPHVVAVRAGGKVTFRSSDDTLHNVHLVGDDNAPALNRPMTGAGQTFDVTFPRPAFVGVRCDVHPWMRASVAVVESGYYAVTADDGAFEIPNVPPGRHALVAWHERYDPQEQTVNLPPDEITDVTFTFPQ